jgi:uncharacterized protein YjbI with pentapeptide repeats
MAGFTERFLPKSRIKLDKSIEPQPNQAKKRSVKVHTFTDDQIRERAHQLWLQRGPDSSAEENWHDAIYVLRREQTIKRLKQPICWLQWKAELGLPIWLMILGLPIWVAWQTALWFWHWSGFKEKKGWDFAQLLAVPLVLALVGWGLNEYAKERDQKQQLTDKEKDQAIADDKAKQDTLVKYFDQMADLLNSGLLKAAPGSEKFIIAQAKTVIALQSLDRKRQHLVIQFLSASGLNKADLILSPFNFDQNGNIRLNESEHVLLYQAEMEKANFTNSDLSGGVFIGVNLRNANFAPDSRCARQNFKISHSQLCTDTDLSNANFTGANFNDANLSRTNLSYAKLRHAVLIDANISHATLIKANLSRADFHNVDLSDANLSDASLSRANLVEANLSRANLSNAYFKNAILIETNLSNADLKNADLSETDLSNANLNNANLSNANLNDSLLLSTDLRAVNLTKEQLEGSPLLCNVALPKEITIDSNRDCDRIPQILFQDYGFKSLKEAKDYVNEARQHKWDNTPQP